MFLTTSDFIGKYKVAKDSYSKEELEYYIDEYEKHYLQELMGFDLYDAFISDLNDDDSPKPQSNRFRKIFEKLQDESDCNSYKSDGILEMLKGFVYYEYVKDQKFRNTITGNVVNETSFSREVPISKSTIESRYNLAINSYVAIQLYIIENKDLYPEFKGIKKRQSYFGGAF